VRYSQSFFK